MSSCVIDDVLADDDDPAIGAITAAELLQGVELADDTNRLARQSFVDTVLATIPVEEYTVDVARAHARLLAHEREAGPAQRGSRPDHRGNCPDHRACGGHP